MNMRQSVETVLRKYAVFSGRASRSEYWWWLLATMIVGMIAQALDYSLFDTENGGAAILSSVFSLVTFVPHISVCARRLHDTNRTGWLQLIPLVAAAIIFASVFTQSQTAIAIAAVLVGISVLLLIYWMIKRGTEGPNDYGEDPLA